MYNHTRNHEIIIKFVNAMRNTKAYIFTLGTYNMRGATNNKKNYKRKIVLTKLINY